MTSTPGLAESPPFRRDARAMVSRLSAAVLNTQCIPEFVPNEAHQVLPADVSDAPKITPSTNVLDIRLRFDKFRVP